MTQRVQLGPSTDDASGTAMNIKLTDELLQELLDSGSQAKISIMFNDATKKSPVLTVNGQEYQLTSTMESKPLELYRQEQSDSVWSKIGSIHRRLNVRRVLNQQLGAKYKNKSIIAEKEYRGRNTLTTDMMGNTGVVSSMKSTAKGKRKKPSAAPSSSTSSSQTIRQLRASSRSSTTSSTRAPTSKAKIAPKASSSSAMSGVDVRTRMIHDLAGAAKGCLLEGLRKKYDLKKYRYLLNELADYSFPAVYKLKAHLYDEVRLDWPGYTREHKERITAKRNEYRASKGGSTASPATQPSSQQQQRQRQQQQQKPPTTKAVSPPKSTTASPEMLTINTSIKPPQGVHGADVSDLGKATPKQVNIPRAKSCPSTPKFEKDGAHSQFVGLPAIRNYDEYLVYKRKFDDKHKKYANLDECLNANSKDFETLGAKLKGCAEKAQAKQIKGEIKKLYKERKAKVEKWTDEYKLLHLQLKDIKRLVNEYVNRWLDRRKRKRQRLEAASS